MRYSEIPKNRAAFFCNHIAFENASINLVATDSDGEIVMTCGCLPSDAQVAGFGHFLDKIPELLECEVAEKGSLFKRASEWFPWAKETTDDF